MRLFAAPILSSALTLSLPLLGQVVARQGVAPVPDPILFKSPMILEFPLPDLRSSNWTHQQVLLPDVWKYQCENHVSLHALAITAFPKGKGADKVLNIEISGLVSVAESYDRIVDILCRIKSADLVVVEGTLQNRKTPEKRFTSFTVGFTTRESDLFGAFTRTPAPTLEITLTVRNDS